MTTPRQWATAVVTGMACLLACQSGSASRLLSTAPELVAPPKWIAFKGGWTGYCPALLQRLSERGFRFEIQEALPQKRLQAQVEAGKLDFVCTLTRVPSREGRYIWLTPKLYRVPFVLVARADDKVEVRNLAELRALGPHAVVILNHDSSRIEVLREQGGLTLDVSSLNTATSLRMLTAGRGRFFYFPQPNALATIQQLGLEREVRLMSSPLEYEDYHLLLGVHVDLDTRRRLIKALGQLQRDGTLARLAREWLKIEPAPISGTRQQR